MWSMLIVWSGIKDKLEIFKFNNQKARNRNKVERNVWRLNIFKERDCPYIFHHQVFSEIPRKKVEDGGRLQTNQKIYGNDRTVCLRILHSQYRSSYPTVVLELCFSVQFCEKQIVWRIFKRKKYYCKNHEYFIFNE